MDQLSERLARLSPEQIAELVQRLRKTETAGPPAASIPRRPGTGPCPLSFSQQRLWFIQQLDPRSVAYNMVDVTRLEGPLDAGALHRALDLVVERHEAVRTVFVLRDGEPAQQVVAGMRVPLETEDLRALEPAEHDEELRRHARREQARPFDLAAGPLMRATLLRLAPERHALLLCMHHAISDGWSRGVIAREISAAYTALRAGEAPRLPELPIQYPDYAVWQRERLRGALLDEQLGYWRETLAGAPATLELPTDHPRPPLQSFAGRTHRFALPDGAVETLRALGRAEGATLFMVLLAAYKALLARYTGQADLVVGTPVANRGRSETHGLVGFFVNTLALRTDLSGDPAFRDVLRRVRESALGAYAHEELPFDRVVEELHPERSLSRSLVFQTMFLLDEDAPRTVRMGGVELVPADVDAGAALFDLTLGIERTGGGWMGRLEYATALFDAHTVERMGAHLCVLLRAAAADPDAPVSRLGLMDDGERAQVARWNATQRDYPAGELVHGLFAAQAARTPDATALVFRGEPVSYAELDARANRLAHHLLALGAEVESRVGVCLERTPALIVALLAVMKAGGAYVPLDPAYPRERLGSMIEDAGVRLVLTTAELAGRLPEAAEPVRIDLLADRIAAESAGAPRTSADPENLSHVIFTSGSTGRPKGVMIRHASTVVLLHWMRENVTDDERAGVLASTSVNFDVSVAEIFGALCWGGRLVLVENALALPDVADQDVRYTSMVPTAAAELLRAGGIPASVRTFNLAGEALPNDLAQALYATGTVVKVGNLYGPTEDTSYSTWALVPRGADRVLIGRPLANSAAHVLDDALRPVPVGIPGELYLAGGGLARGYMGHPALTAERFLPDPDGAAGSRMYRTMDRVRWTASGELEYFGRTDFQVKVRGFRIELGEIETALRAHPAIQHAVAVVRAEADGDRRLVAYAVAADGHEAPDAAALRAHLKERLPEYMVPSAFVALDALPLTPNGKLDRRALPAPDAPGGDAQAYLAPRTPGETQLAGLFADVLGLVRVGVNDDFFDAGGHSLLAMRVVTRMRGMLGVEMPVRTLFEAPTVAELAARVESLLRDGAVLDEAPLVPVPRDGPVPLSFAQQRLWFIQQLDPANVAYNMLGVLRLDGTLDAGALQGALDTVVDRHEALRTVFVQEGGEPVQRVVQGMRVVMDADDLRALGPADRDAEVRRHVRIAQTRPFDLEVGPLLRAVLLRLEAGHHVLLLVMHHVISDGWSRGVIVREISAAYTALVEGDAPRLPALPVQYPDYAVWQRARLQGEFLARQLDYWRATLAGAPPVLALPADHPRPPMQSFSGAEHRFRLPEGIAEPLHALARAEGATLFMVLLAAFKTLLARYTGEADLVVGTPVANRGRGETEGLVGFFANMLAVRTDLSGDPAFRDVLRRVRESALGAYAHEEVPFERLVEEVGAERSLSRNQIFQTVFLLDEAPVRTFHLPGLELAPVEVESDTSMFDLTLALARDGAELVGRLEYATALFDASTAQRMTEHLCVLLRGIAADPDAPVSRLPLMSDADRAQVAGWNATERGYPVGALVHGLFAAQAARTPDATALVHRGEPVSYAELDARANRLANHLLALGAGVETRIGVCLDRTPALIVALLAVLKTGGAYVPLDPAYPRERLGYMIEDAGVRLVLTTGDLADQLPDAAEPVRIDLLADRIAAESAEAPRTGVQAENLSHVIFTSGSTGRPKGVMIRHASTVALLHWLRENVTDEERTGVLGSTSINFDVSVAEIFGTLCWGGRLVLVENALALPEVAGQDVRYASMVPTAAAELLRAGGIPSSVRTLNLGGEALPNDLAQALYATGIVVKVGNLYGPTEDTTYSTYSVVQPGADRVLVGRPVANTTAHVLDDALRPVPVGIVGELYLAGDGLARGYAGHPALTAERFVPDPFGAAGSRMYRVMDRIRWTASGELEYFGRTDFQVKVRGFRIELGEIEAALRAHPDIQHAVAIVREDAPGDRRLVAYLVAGEHVPSTAALRAHLKERLPEYMVPSAFVALDSLPLTPNSKLDRRALPAPDASRSPADAYTAPRTPGEAQLAGIFADVLGVERIGVHDDFFHAGGHSLLAMRAVTRVRDTLHVEMPVRTLFEAPTVAELAVRVEGLLRDGSVLDEAPLVPVHRDGALPLSFAQQRLWFIQQLDPANVAYNMLGVIRLDGTLDAGALQGALDTVVDRHEALRTVFVQEGGEPVQRVVQGMRVVMETDDLRALPGTERDAEVQRRIRIAQTRPFDLEAGPLLRAVLLRLEAGHHVLLLVMHHVISDGWSRGVIVREISAAYTALVEGDAPRLPALPVQYPDYAVWQRARLQGDFLARQLDYWRATLAGAPPVLALPADHPRPPLQSFAGAGHRFRLPEGIAEPLHALARAEGATLFMVLLAAFKTLLARYTGQADLVVGTPVANRGRGETEGLVGFFANMLAVRTDLSGDPAFRDVLRRVRESALGAYAHEEVPFERLVEEVGAERSLSRNQIFQTVFLLDETPVRTFHLPGLELAPVEVESDTSMFDLTLALARDGGELVGRLEYATALFDASTAQRMTEHLCVLLRGIAADPDAPVSRLPLMSDADRAQVAGWNATDRGSPADVLAPALFAAQAARTPDAPALVHGGQTVSYGELDARAGRLASYLRRLGVDVETRVGVCLERTPELIVALLAVHRAGGAYVPLDPAYPRERLGYMIEDAGVRFVITSNTLADRLPVGARPVCVDALRERIATEPAAAGPIRVGPDNLSHVIFTSGSTGRPKGVMIRHSSTAVLVHWMRDNVPDDDRAAALASTSINFDVSVAEIFGTLCWGGKLVLVDNALALPDVAHEGIRYASMVPTAAAELLRAGGIPSTVRTLFLGGEALPSALAQGLYALGTVETVGNLYGPTEDTTYSTYSRVRSGADRVLVGGPVAHTRAYVLDGALRPVAVGIIGELYLAGEGLARGYAGRPDLTAERFVPDPFGAPGSRMYRVMDRVRWTASGELEYFGRTDFQVKIRGFRIELGEIETALASHPAVRDCVVTAWDDGTGERRLVAYVTASAGEEPASPSELRRWVGERLPEYMVPSLFVALDALPLTPNGKTDRGALPDPGPARPELDEAYAPPRNGLEGTITDVWREVLGVERVGIRDNFFELGGTSVRLASMHRLLAERLEREVTVVDLFRYPTVAGLAEYLGQEDDGGARRKGEVQDRAERQRLAQAARRGRERRR